MGFLNFRFNGLFSINWESALSHKLMQELFNRVGIAPRGPMGADNRAINSALEWLSFVELWMLN